MKNEKVIIGLVGESGSGKDTVANYLAEKHGAKLVRFADPLREALSIYFDNVSRADLQWLAIVFRERFGNDILGRALRKKIEASEGIVVLNGVRMPEDLEFVRSFRNSHVVYVTANQELRWQRTTKRSEKSDDAADFERFKEMEKVATEVHIPEIGKQADFTIRNEDDLETLLRSVDEMMAKIEQ